MSVKRQFQIRLPFHELDLKYMKKPLIKRGREIAEGIYYNSQI